MGIGTRAVTPTCAVRSSVRLRRTLGGERGELRARLNTSVVGDAGERHWRTRASEATGVARTPVAERRVCGETGPSGLERTAPARCVASERDGGADEFVRTPDVIRALGRRRGVVSWWGTGADAYPCGDSAVAEARSDGAMRTVPS